MKRRFRLTKSTDYQRVRRLGKSYAHPLIVLIALPNGETDTHWGMVAGKSVGGAVQRNRAKRLMRSAGDNVRNQVQKGWDLVLIARQPLVNAEFDQVQNALDELLQRARVLRDLNDE